VWTTKVDNVTHNRTGLAPSLVDAAEVEVG